MKASDIGRIRCFPAMLVSVSSLFLSQRQRLSSGMSDMYTDQSPGLHVYATHMFTRERERREGGGGCKSEKKRGQQERQKERREKERRGKSEKERERSVRKTEGEDKKEMEQEREK
ncbi:hypothetical protein WMY93_003370 [Mugilogobius chulae]|uniref:Uncharacterized protein n=1 Tax=Mugilogobius chulae TaxID=88201 RepID=A0AAW0PZ57_9GOBI